MHRYSLVLLVWAACTQSAPPPVVAPSAAPPSCPAAPRPRPVDKPLLDEWFDAWRAARACVVRQQRREACIDELELVRVDAQLVSYELFGHAQRLAEATTQSEQAQAIEQLDLDARVLEPFRMH